MDNSEERATLRTPAIYLGIARKRHVLLAGYDRPTPMAWDVAYKYKCCRKELKENILRTREQERTIHDRLAMTK